jgi:hypothetical protein
LKGYGFFQFGNGLRKFFLRNVHLSQPGMGRRIQRVDLDLFLELLNGLVVLQFPLIGRSQAVVCVLIVGVDLDLLLERGDGLIVLVES